MINETAQQRIDQARQSRATWLDLRSLKLTELPETLRALAQLQSLYLGGNQLASIPTFLGDLALLRSLDVRFNSLTQLPHCLGKLTNLQTFYLGGNRLSDLPDSIGQLTALQSLDLSDNLLRVLPTSIGQLSQLQALYVARNQLSALPDALCDCKQLRVLDLADNDLQELSPLFINFKRLQSLDVQKNQLAAVPDAVGELRELEALHLGDNRIEQLPRSLGQLTQLRALNASMNRLSSIPRSFGKLSRLTTLELDGNQLITLPPSMCKLGRLESLNVARNRLTALPQEIGTLVSLTSLLSQENELTDLPDSLASLPELHTLSLEGNPLNPELSSARNEGLAAIKRYLRAKAHAEITLNEAKLILVGEGAVGKSSLLGALRGDPWEENRPTTHGIEIKPMTVIDLDSGISISMKGWDFGGQRVSRPTHQLFFTAPAVYLVVWKPREGLQQGFVIDWIRLIKHREPDAKILVVATHGGPKERQPDIDRQEIWDIFGKETVVGFLHVDSCPTTAKDTDAARNLCDGIEQLRAAIARLAASLPEVGRTVPRHWQKAREEISSTEEAYLTLDAVFAICAHYGLDNEDAKLLLRICRQVGEVIYFEHDPILRDIVVIRPNWLGRAISFVLDDKETRDDRHGLVKFSHLARLWDNPTRDPVDRYPSKLHPVFLRLMERFDLSYRIAEGTAKGDDVTSLVAQLVGDIRPEPIPEWPLSLRPGDEEQVQICRIVDASTMQSARAEGLFYQLIVRLHKYSLGRMDHSRSVHWQRGLVVEDNTGARALLENIGSDVRITVRSPYAERFLSALTYEVKWLVESFWEGLLCEVTVPCLRKSVDGANCKGVFDVSKLIENKGRGRLEQPCVVCNQWQSIEELLHNAPAARPEPLADLLTDYPRLVVVLEDVRRVLAAQQTQMNRRFDQLDVGTREILSKVEAGYTGIMRTLQDDAKDGPRLFSFEPVDPGFFDRPRWISAEFRLVLWCEHSRLPLWKVSADPSKGVYKVALPRDWLMKAAPLLRALSGALGLLLPIVVPTSKTVLSDEEFKRIEAQLELGKSCAESLLKGGEQGGSWLAKKDDMAATAGGPVRAEGGMLWQLHSLLRKQDPTFGGLARVQNKRHEYLWVHPKFAIEY